MALTASWPGVDALSTTTHARRNLAGMIVKDTAGVARAGIFPAHTNALVTARTDMNVDIAAFTGAAVQFGGPVLIANDGVAQLPAPLVSPGAGTNFYVIYAKQNESASPGTDANNNRVFGAQLSTTSFTVARAAMPAGALELGTVEMPTGKTATNQAGVVITPTHQFTAAAGGVVLLRNATEKAAWTPGLGSRAFRLDTECQLEMVDGAWQGDWVAATLAAGWTVPPNMGTPSWRVVNGVVEFTGVARYSAVVPGANTNFMTGLPVPVGSDAEALVMRATTKNGLTVIVNPRSDGVARARLVGAGGAGDDYVYLDGLSYKAAV